jgi:hypothetical protein
MKWDCGVVGCEVLRRVEMEVLWRRRAGIVSAHSVRVCSVYVWEVWEAFVVGGGAAIAVSRNWC